MSTAHYGRAVPVGLRRFPKLNVKVVKDSKKVKLPDYLPPGFHIVLLMFKNNHHWEARTWNVLYNKVTQLVQVAHKSILKEHNMNTTDKEDIPPSLLFNDPTTPPHPQLYYLWVFGRLKWLWSYFWIKRCRDWVKLQNNNNVTSTTTLPPLDNVLVTYTDKEWLEKRLGIINDGRPYVLLIKNNGKILFCHHGHYDPNLHDYGIRKAVREEMERKENDIIKITAVGGGGGAKDQNHQHIPLLQNNNNNEEEEEELK